MGVTFDLDVASPGPNVVPWVPANRWYSDGALERPWDGFVWMNPPFGGRNAIVPWMEKFMAHGNGVALCPDRTSAPWWQTYAPQADLILFVSPKIKFVPGEGVKSSSPGQGTTLMAKGPQGVQALRNAHAAGRGLLLVSA
jgi:hypothetical protein